MAKTVKELLQEMLTTKGRVLCVFPTVGLAKAAGESFNATTNVSVGFLVNTPFTNLYLVAESQFEGCRGRRYNSIRFFGVTPSPKWRELLEVKSDYSEPL